MLVGELRVRDRQLPLEGGVADRLESLVRLRVDPRHEEARHRSHFRHVLACGDRALQAADVRLDHRLVPVEREDERHVDGLRGGDAVLDRREPGHGAGDLDEQVRPLDLRVQAHGLLVGRLALVGERRVDLQGHEAVDAVGALVDGLHQVASLLDVLDRQREEELLAVVRLLRGLGELLVVPVALGHRLLEDRRVGRDADDGVLVHEPLQLAGLEHLPGQRVDPDGHAVLGELMQS
jgi:hypothetical protein